MNKAIIMGRLTRDPEVRTTPSQVAVATFTVAVDRRFKNANGEKQADFIPVVAWRKLSEIVSRYFRKGSRIIVVGSIQTRNWEDKDGNKRTSTEIIADEIHFVDSKKESEQNAYQQHSGQQQYGGQVDANAGYEDAGFLPAPDDDTSLPFDL